MKNINSFIIGVFTILLFSLSANAATWAVTKSTNSNDNICDADCSLREAVFNADSGDTVVFNSNLIGQTFTLGGSEIVITKRITIDGNIDGVNVAFISGSNTSRIFHIQAGGGLELKNAILVQGSGESSPGVPANPTGGAIRTEPTASLTMDRVAIRGNSAVFGGAIYILGGTHRITNSSISTNTAETATAINVLDGANVYISNTTMTGNLVLPDTAGSAGAGAISVRASQVIIRNSTITRNTARRGGGILTIVGATDSRVELGNTIVGGNSATEDGADISYFPAPGIVLASVGGNLIQDSSNLPANIFNQPNDQTGVNPLLGPINANLGGHPILYHPLQAGSPALNTGLNANAVDPLTNQPLTTDTRGTGFPRIIGGTVDKGAFEDQTNGFSLIVTKNSNSNDFVCDSDCSLREAVYQASVHAGTDTITFAPNVFGTLSTGATEILIQNQNVNIVGYPTLNAESLIASGNNTHRILHLDSATANISGMTLANGNAGVEFGGAILSENNSNLTLDKVIVRNNFATAYGAIYSSGGTARIINSTINNNSANTGLAIGVSGTLNMANTTVSSNLDADGGTGIGAIYVTGTANIRNSTIAFNRTSGGTGGGIFNAGTLNIGNSIVANNIAAVSPDIELSSGSITSVGGNLVQNTNGFPMGTFSQTNDVVNVDPLLGTLGNNGGNVTTHALQANSQAINSGINSNAIDPFDNSILAMDARGGNFLRIVDTTVDKGAFESLAPTAASVSISGRVLTSNGRGLSRVTVYLTNQQGITRTARTSSFGYFRFENVEVGQTYIANVFSKQYQFTPQVVSVVEEISELNFTALE